MISRDRPVILESQTERVNYGKAVCRAMEEVMAKCRCDSQQWRILEKKSRMRAKYDVICLTCEFTWWTDNNAGLQWISEEERKKWRDPFARFS